MKNNIEKNLQKAFENYQADLNNDEIWENIEPHLKKKKKRRFIWLWFLLGAIGLGSLFVNKDKLTSYKIDKQERISQRKVEKKQTAKIVDKEEICLDDVKTKTIAEDKKLSKKVAKSKRKLERRAHKTSNITDSYIAGFSEDNNEAEEVFVEGTSIENIQKEASKEVIDVYDEGDTEQNVEKESLPVIAQNEEDTDKERGKKKPVKNTKKDKKVKKKKKAKKKKKKRKKKKRSNPWQNYAQFTTGFVLPAKSLQTTSGGVGIHVLDKRRETESFVDAFAFNFNIQSVHKRGFVVQSGLEYVQIDEKFSFKEVEEREVIETGIVGVVENERGEIIDMISGPKLIKTTEIREVKEYNNYRFVNIPVGVGRSWKYRRNYYKFIAGLEYNIFFDFDGKFFTSFDSYSGGGGFTDSPGLGLWLSGEYKHSINKRLSWVLAPKIRVPFNPITREESPRFIQKYYTLNLNVGLTYFLNPKKKKKKRN